MSPGRKRLGKLRWLVLGAGVLTILMVICTQGPAIPAAKANLVDINAATQVELEAVKGIGPVTAKKIIDNRPYKSLTELKKAGLSPKAIKDLKPFLTAKAAPAPATAAPATAPGAKPSAEPAQAATGKKAKAPEPAAGAPVDLNAADQKTLEALPGIGPALAKKIIEARPFQSVDDLSKVKGLSKAKVEALKGKVTVGSAAAAAAPAAQPAPVAKPAPAAQPAPATPAAPAPPAAEKATPAPEPVTQPKPAAAAKGKKEAPKLAPGQRVNINKANQEELEKLPGIGPVKAKAIIKGRPYKNPEDIMKVRGIKEGMYNKLKDFINVQ